MAIITDIPWVNESTGEVRRGFYMDRWLAQNLEKIPAHLAKGWDVVAIVSGTGMVRTGKTMIPSTEILIYSDDKIISKPLSSFKDKEIINTVSFDQVSGNNIVSKSEVIVEDEDKDFYKVITKNGHEIECTKEHKLFIKRDNKLQKVQLKDLKIGDELAYSVPSNKFFYLKGSFDGDGCYSKKRSYITINVVDVDFLEEIKKQIKDVFNKDVKIINYVEAHDNCQAQKRINFGPGNQNFNLLKTIQPLTLNDKIEYLKGIFDAEGSIGLYKKRGLKKDGKYICVDRMLRISQKDNTRLDVWYDYMQELGIKSIKMYRDDSRSELSIRDNESIIRFAQLIGFRINRKQKVLDKVIEYISKHQSWVGSENKDKILRIYKKTNFGAGHIGLMFNRSDTSIKSMLKRNGIVLGTGKSRQLKISLKDIKRTEKILGRRLNFKITSGMLDKDLKDSGYAEVTINQCNMNELDRINKERSNSTEQVASVMTRDYSEIDKQIKDEDILPYDPNVSWNAPEDKIRTCCQYKPKYDKVLRTSKIISIEFFKRLKGYDLYTPEYHNFFLANGILSHNSTLAIQMATFVDWCIAGGKMVWNDEGQVVGVIPPKKKTRFNLDHVVFTPDDLVKITKTKGKHENNNVFVLDEGREGLLGARAMEQVNKSMDDYFQTCGVYNNFIVIVLPDFFKLAEQYCVNRSLFLVNVFHRNFERGYFSFFNTLQKERLYFFGKKRLGITARYNAASRNFWGRFSKWMPFDLKQYEDKKKFFIGKHKNSKLEVTHMRQRDLLTYVIRNRLGWTYEQISKELERFGEDTYGVDAVMRAIRNGERIINDAKYYSDGEEEPEQDIHKPVLIKQDADFSGLEEGAVEKVREPDVNPYGVEYDNADVNEKNWAPITKVGTKNIFVAKNSNDGVNPETIDEERLAMDAIKENTKENLGGVAFSSGEGDPIFDQSKIDRYKVDEKKHINPFEPDVYDNTSESGYASDAREGIEDSDDKVLDINDEDAENSEIQKKKLQEAKLFHDSILDSEDEEVIANQEYDLEGKYRYNP